MSMSNRINIGGFCWGGLHHNLQQPKTCRSGGVLPHGYKERHIASKKRYRVCMRSSNEYGDSEHQQSSPDDLGDDNDDGLLHELRQYRGEESTCQDKQHLDLLWTVSSSVMTKNTRTDFTKECPTCNGTGEIECQYCNGTGALTVGDMLFCDNTGCRQCPVCSGGTMKCSTCKGTGHYASWMIHK